METSFLDAAAGLQMMQTQPPLYPEFQAKPTLLHSLLKTKWGVPQAGPSHLFDMMNFFQKVVTKVSRGEPLSDNNPLFGFVVVPKMRYKHIQGTANLYMPDMSRASNQDNGVPFFDRVPQDEDNYCGIYNCIDDRWKSQVLPNSTFCINTFTHRRSTFTRAACEEYRLNYKDQNGRFYMVAHRVIENPDDSNIFDMGIFVYARRICNSFNSDMAFFLSPYNLKRGRKGRYTAFNPPPSDAPRLFDPILDHEKACSVLIIKDERGVCNRVNNKRKAFNVPVDDAFIKVESLVIRSKRQPNKTPRRVLKKNPDMDVLPVINLDEPVVPVFNTADDLEMYAAILNGITDNTTKKAYEAPVIGIMPDQIVQVVEAEAFFDNLDEQPANKRKIDETEDSEERKRRKRERKEEKRRRREMKDLGDLGDIKFRRKGERFRTEMEKTNKLAEYNITDDFINSLLN